MKLTLTPSQEKALATLTDKWSVRMIWEHGWPPRELDELVVLGLAERRPVYRESELKAWRVQQYEFRLKGKR